MRLENCWSSRFAPILPVRLRITTSHSITATEVSGVLLWTLMTAFSASIH